MLTSDFIKNAAGTLGFDACGVLAIEPLPDKYWGRFNEWLQADYHGCMSYMQRHMDKRADPRRLLRGGAQTAVVILFSYNTAQRQSQHLPQVSRYAYGQDYHELLKKKLWALLKVLQAENPKLRGRTFADTAPLQERYWAVAAGLGWIGKNGMLINKQLGSYTFIGTLLLNAKVESMPQPTKNYCGTCTRCMAACPSQAIVNKKVVDSRKCLAYQTIELHSCGKSLLCDEEKMRNASYAFGCDVCQEVCPWNEKAKVVEHAEMQLQQYLQQLTKSDWLNMTEEDFEKKFEHSVIKRATLKGMQENMKLV